MAWQRRLRVHARNSLPWALGLMAGLVACGAPDRSTPASGTADNAPGEYHAGAAAFPLPSAAEASATACAGCHSAETAAWTGSQHAHAMTAVVATEPTSSTHPAGTRVGWIGVSPFRQPLVDGGDGRIWVADPAEDTRTGERFALFDAPERDGATPHASRIWNSQCATCHMTGLSIGYDPASDRFTTRADATGIGCAACHPDAAAHRDSNGATPASAAQPTETACLPCHARREPLQTAPRGARFEDGYRLDLADAPGLYHADGQAADEVFEAGSLALSAMGAAGVTCLDCHDPHSGGLVAPSTNDALCLGCHGATGSGRLAATAPDIDPGTHTHHPAASEGARCVSCHMPTQTFAGRDRRRDHAFSSPDPALASQIGAPDACTSCHTEWTQAQAAAMRDQAWGPPRTSQTRSRAQAIAAARANAPDAATSLLAALNGERNPAWRATLAGLLTPWASEASVGAQLEALLGEEAPAVRMAAVRALASAPARRARLERLRVDPVRGVRLAAAWATRSSLPQTGPLHDEVLDWLSASADQPAGAMRWSEFARSQGQGAEAVEWAERAVRAEPSGPSYHTLARALHAAGRRAEAASALDEAKRRFAEAAAPTRASTSAPASGRPPR